MPGSADFVQQTVHLIEAGAGAPWVRRALAVLAITGLALFYFIHEFRGLATSQAMDQAQIGRELARGHGFATKFVRPLAIGELRAHGRDVAQQIWTDTYNAPLPSIVNALALLPIKSRLLMTPRDIIYLGDRAIAVAAILLFIAAVAVLFFTARLLFDERLALLGCALVFLCDMMWQFALSGLPQMLMLLLFHGTVYALVRALLAREATAATSRWLAAAGAGFGLLALSHALTIWIFAAALIYAIFAFRPWGRGAALMLAVFALTYTPWLVRNAVVSGNPGGMAIYAAIDGLGHPEAGHFRRMAVDYAGAGFGTFRNNVTANFTAQTGRLFEYLGGGVVAPVFFLTLLHRFRREETTTMRWLLLAMWGAAVVGMAVYGLHEEFGVAANQLHLLFVPMMTCFGLAYLLVQWNRLEIELPFVRLGFLTLLFGLCAIPMVANFLASNSKPMIRWKPYAPPYISVLNRWMEPDEVTASDMPWAIAWYADRRSVWLPENLKAMTDLSDYNVLGAPVNGLYLTPISGSQATLAEILKGEYKDWGTVILRSVEVSKFPLKWATLLGFESECVFFADHDRQQAKAP